MAEQAAPVVNESVVAQDTTPTASTPVETASPEVADDSAFEQGFDDGETPADKPTDTKVEEDTVEPDEGDNPEPTEAEANEAEQPRGKADERKEQLNNEIRDLVSQRNAIRAQVERLNNEAYQPATDQELLGQINPETGDYYNPLEAKVASMQQAQEMERYNSQVADAQLTLSSQATRALSDFPIFDEASPEYNPTITQGVDQILGQNLVFDQNTGQVIGSSVDPYQLYKTFAETARLSAEKGQINGQRATEKMLASAEPTSNAPQKVAKEDAFLKGFDLDD